MGMSSSTKHLKEQFVSNLTGSSMLEVATLSVLVPAVVVLRKWSVIYEKKGIGLKKSANVVAHTKVWWRFIISLALDFLFVVVPILAFLTILSDKVYACTFLLSVTVIVILLAKRSWSSTISHGLGDRSYLRINLSSYRVLMMIVTCLCILAVDFNIFPRRYAKTETYGTSLMDLGVGSFVVANSLVSRQARNIMSVNWKYAFRSTTPPLILGVVRLLTTAGVDYQVHVGEYGAHWNFFFTLAAVFMLTSFINIHPKYCGLVALLILTAYQACLLCGLNEYLLSNNRALDIISQNKEGLFSIFGYWGMYLAGVYLGYMLFQSESTILKLSIQTARARAWMLTVMFWLVTVILDKYVERVSRRMCNLAYVTLVFAQNFEVLAILLVSGIGQQLLVLEEAINQEMLGTFLLANVLTGLVNMYADTLSTSSLAAFLILLGYSATLSASIGIASFKGVKLKTW